MNPQGKNSVSEIDFFAPVIKRVPVKIKLVNGLECVIWEEKEEPCLYEQCLEKKIEEAEDDIQEHKRLFGDTNFVILHEKRLRKKTLEEALQNFRNKHTTLTVEEKKRKAYENRKEGK